MTIPTTILIITDRYSIIPTKKMLKFLIAQHSMAYMYSFKIKDLSTNFFNTIVKNSRRVRRVQRWLVRNRKYHAHVMF